MPELWLVCLALSIIPAPTYLSYSKLHGWYPMPTDSGAKFGFATEQGSSGARNGKIPMFEGLVSEVLSLTLRTPCGVQLSLDQTDLERFIFTYL